MLDNYHLNQLAEPLLAWFVDHARVLPWRERPEPYRVWVSEIMLQQTRVEAVKPYYERFLKALPDAAALAACPEDQLMKLWEGLESELNYNVMHSQRGLINLFHSDGQRDAFVRRGNAMINQGDDAILLDREGVREHLP